MTAVHPSTPVCFTCGAKHSRDRVTGLCRKCGNDPRARDKRAKAAYRVKAVSTSTVTERRVLKARVRSMTAEQKKRKHGRNV